MMRDPMAPPAWAEALLLAILPADRAETVSGDLLEAYRDEQLPAQDRAGADRWYLKQVALVFLHAFWRWVVPLVGLFVMSDVSNTWRYPIAGWTVPVIGPGVALAAAFRGGWRTGRAAGGLVAGAAVCLALWLFIAAWWMATWYPFAFVQQTEPYWIDAWHYSAAPGETFLHWIFWDNVGAIVMSGLSLGVAGVALGFAGGLAGLAARRVYRVR